MQRKRTMIRERFTALREEMKFSSLKNVSKLTTIQKCNLIALHLTSLARI